MRWPFVTRRERIRREAADWIARLNGPHNESDRAEFERWYHSHPEHLRAYDRLSEIFRAAGQVRRIEGVADGPLPGRSRPLGYALATAVVGAVLFAFVLLSARMTLPVPKAPQQFGTFSADRDQSRRIGLVDGSEILLSPASSLVVTIGTSERRLRLTSGEGRFSVAHDERPFIVEAGGTEVVARGTRFVISLAPGRTTVSLIEGRVDVSYSAPPGPAEGRRVSRLAPGERLVVETGTGPSTAAAPAASRRSPVPPLAMLEFDETPLDRAVEQMNRHGSTRIRLGDPALAGLRITGAFRAADTRGFARSVAAAFGLELEQAADGLWLRPGAGGARPE